MADDDSLTDEHAHWREQMKRAGMGPLGDTMCIEVEVDGTEVVGRMPVKGNTQPYGILHGGATGVLVETVGSIAAALGAGPGKLPVGIELSVSHHRATSQGWVSARTQTVHRGRTLVSFIVPVHDDEGRLLATGRLTCLLRDAAS